MFGSWVRSPWCDTILKVVSALRFKLSASSREVAKAAEAPSARKDDASPSRPFQPPGGLMEPIDASLQRGRQG